MSRDSKIGAMQALHHFDVVEQRSAAIEAEETPLNLHQLSPSAYILSQRR